MWARFIVVFHSRESTPVHRSRLCTARPAPPLLTAAARADPRRRARGPTAHRSPDCPDNASGNRGGESARKPIDRAGRPLGGPGHAAPLGPRQFGFGAARSGEGAASCERRGQSETAPFDVPGAGRDWDRGFQKISQRLGAAIAGTSKS